MDVSTERIKFLRHFGLISSANEGNKSYFMLLPQDTQKMKGARAVTTVWRERQPRSKK
jgi:hypothetical protein